MRFVRPIQTGTLGLILLPALAMSYNSHTHSSDSDFLSVTDGGTLIMHSSSTSGIVVDRVAPALYQGLKTGDVIDAVNGHHVTDINDLQTAVEAQCKTSVSLKVLRAGQAASVTWRKSECQVLIPPPPPPPPPPPAPPPPPSPPAPPAPPAH